MKVTWVASYYRSGTVIQARLHLRKCMAFRAAVSGLLLWLGFRHGRVLLGIAFGD